MDYEKRKQVAEWLNTLGYDFEITSDGLWMEDYDFTEHKTKDVIDIVLAWEEKRLNEAKATLPINSVMGRFSDADVRNIVLEMQNATMHAHSHNLNRFETRTELHRVKKKWGL